MKINKLTKFGAQCIDFIAQEIERKVKYYETNLEYGEEHCRSTRSAEATNGLLGDLEHHLHSFVDFHNINTRHLPTQELLRIACLNKEVVSHASIGDLDNEYFYIKRYPVGDLYINLEFDELNRGLKDNFGQTLTENALFALLINAKEIVKGSLYKGETYDFRHYIDAEGRRMYRFYRYTHSAWYIRIHKDAFQDAIQQVYQARQA